MALAFSWCRCWQRAPQHFQHCRLASVSVREAQRDGLSLELLVACQGLSAMTLPLVGAESIWVGLGKTAALRIYILVTVNTEN